MSYLLIKMKILDLVGSWWLWKWFLTNGVTKRLFNLDLEHGIVCGQKTSQPQSWRKVTKGFLNLETGERWSKDFSTLKPELFMTERAILPQPELLKCQSRASLLRSELLKYRSKVFFTSIWTIEMLIKGFSTSIWSCWNVDQRSSLL